MEFKDIDGDTLAVNCWDADRNGPARIAIDINDYQCVIFTDRDEVARIRDALTRWLETGDVES